MKVILLKPVTSLGLAGSVVNVSDGFAVNYLIPQKLASSNLIVTTHKVQVGNGNQPLTQVDKDLLNSVANLQVVIKVTANDKGKLYEAIKAGQVASVLRSKKKINVKAEQLHFIKPIKELGEHQVNLKIANQAINFKLIVEKI